LGNDGAFVNKHVEYFFEDSNEWCLRKLIGYNTSNDNEYTELHFLMKIFVLLSKIIHNIKRCQGNSVIGHIVIHLVIM
jgi:hypothetical protein